MQESSLLYSAIIYSSKVAVHGVIVTGEIALQIGLGTDVSGGYSPSMLSAVRNAVVTSKALRMQSISKGLSLEEADKDLLTWKEALYLATQGGARALGIQVRHNLLSFACRRQSAVSLKCDSPLYNCWALEGLLLASTADHAESNY